MRKFFRELGEFASQRAVADVALGIIIGAALSDLVKVIVEEVILPPISFFTQGINLENKALVLREAGSIDGVIPVEDIAIGYGKLIEVSIAFLIIGLLLFFIFRSTRHLWQDSHPLQQEDKGTALLKQTVELLEKQNKLLENQFNNQGQKGL